MPSTAASRPAALGAHRRPGRIALWALQVALALAFVGAAFAKLTGDPAQVQVFEAVGVGQWFRSVTAVIELVGAVLLLVPALAGLGALLLAGVMVGATAAHVLVLDTPPVSIALLVALLVVVVVRRAELATMVARRRGRHSL